MRASRVWAGAGLLAVLSGVALSGAAAQAPTITPVEGPSQLQRLRLPLPQTSMGLTGHWGPRPDLFKTTSKAEGSVVRLFGGSTTLSGSDLYRLDCQGCHKADGHGAPPEINTLMDPVQGTSLVLWTRRMQELGRPVDPSFARQIVEGSRADLLNRLVHGGEKMPPFEFLSADEIQALVAYLNVLADVPDASRPRQVTEPVLRVGEHLVKGTCHICHPATGSWPDPQALLDGAIPPLSGFTGRFTLSELIQKVRHGAPVEMSAAHVMFRGRMPVFNYLSDEEVESVYMYLAAYPPQ
jgi:mono/diheme cytochrome c family protein